MCIFMVQNENLKYFIFMYSIELSRNVGSERVQKITFWRTYPLQGFILWECLRLVMRDESDIWKLWCPKTGGLEFYFNILSGKCAYSGIRETYLCLYILYFILEKRGRRERIYIKIIVVRALTHTHTNTPTASEIYNVEV